MKWSEVAQLCPTLCDPMICSLPGSSLHGILQARILEWVAIPFSKGSCQSRNQIYISCLAGRFFITEPLGKIPTMEYYSTIKKNKIMPFTALWIDLEIVILSEVSQRKTNIIWYHLYVESKKMIQMNLFTKQKYTHRHRKQTYDYQDRDKLGIWD